MRPAGPPITAAPRAETVEFTALLEVFGRVDESGDRYLTLVDIEGLWLETRYPDGWDAAPRGLHHGSGFHAERGDDDCR